MGEERISESVARSSDPAVNDVLAQQMGTNYEEVESMDKQDLQNEIKNQATTADDIQKIHSDQELTDDRNTSDGQLIGS